MALPACSYRFHTIWSEITCSLLILGTPSGPVWNKDIYIIVRFGDWSVRHLLNCGGLVPTMLYLPQYTTYFQIYFEGADDDVNVESHFHTTIFR